MTDDTGETPLEQRVERLEHGQQAQDSKLDQILAMLSGTKQPPVTHETAERQTEERLDRPSSVAEMVRAELARAKAETDEKSERETIGQRLAKLEEKQPEPPQPRRQRVMWGDRR